MKSMEGAAVGASVGAGVGAGLGLGVVAIEEGAAVGRMMVGARVG